MKKHLFVLLCICLICIPLCACGDNTGSETRDLPALAGNLNQADRSLSDDSNSNDSAAPVDEIVPGVEPGADEGSQKSEPESSIKQTAPAQSDSDVDFDLTKLGSTMLFAEVTNILSNPNDYMGKTIRIRGMINNSYYEETDKYYQYVLVGDAAACCQQGLEFIWSGDHTYPDDYPEDNAQIEVTGVYGRYEELGVGYCYLDVDELIVLK